MRTCEYSITARTDRPEDCQKLKGSLLTELTYKQKQDMKEASELSDADKTGTIDFHELKVVLLAIGLNVKKRKLLELCATIIYKGEVGFKIQTSSR